MCKSAEAGSVHLPHAGMVMPETINHRWRLDLVTNAFTNGRRFRVLEVFEDFSQKCMAHVP